MIGWYLALGVIVSALVFSVLRIAFLVRDCDRLD